eukprot:jgi/Tetstr1/438351/TSEL_026918.t1
MAAVAAFAIMAPAVLGGSPRGQGSLQPSAARRLALHGRHRLQTRAMFGADKGGSSKGDFGRDLAKMAKQVRDSLPIVGLISRLTTPEGIGGKDIPTYPEFCRNLLETSPEGFNEAIVKLQSSATTETAGRQFVMLCLWISKFGAGIINDGQIAKAGLRLPITRDLEAEMDRFEMDRTAIVSKYPLMEPPQPDLAKGAVLAVDSISMLCYGVQQTDGLPEGAAERIAAVVAPVFPEVGAEAVKEAVLTRPTRSYVK